MSLGAPPGARRPAGAPRVREGHTTCKPNPQRTRLNRRTAGRGAHPNTIGSVESELATPLTSAYAAAKHAAKGFTDALRMELDAEPAPIAVSLIKPGAIDTPFFEHAKNYLESSCNSQYRTRTPEAGRRHPQRQSGRRTRGGRARCPIARQ
ncbi:MAG TPA: SDR family NAD(P)-dependent oxidoreductase [Polyangiaceae bacterium]|nr:SDR family NAD(P)-dependent oxidoreductase [Polyangiaceae bacterium]